MAMNSQDHREYLFKVLVIGDISTGKTSIIQRYVHKIFSNNYRSTIGVDFALKVIRCSDNTIIRLQLWDVAGQERFGSMTRVYYKEASGAFIVYDSTRPPTFVAVNKWKADLDTKVQLENGRPVPAVLLANKCDIKGMTKDMAEQLDDYCSRNKFTGWFATSAKQDKGITEAANHLIKQIILAKENCAYEDAVLDKSNEVIRLQNSTANGYATAYKQKSCCSLLDF